MKNKEISKREWHLIRTLRGQATTGYPAHRVGKKPIPGKPGFVVGTGPTYYWPMGMQPDDATITKIMHKCPLVAADLFLDHYLPAGNPPYNPPMKKEQA